MSNRIFHGWQNFFRKVEVPMDTPWSQACFTVCGTLYNLLANSALSDNASYALLSQPRLLHEFPVLLSPGRFQDDFRQSKWFPWVHKHMSYCCDDDTRHWSKGATINCRNCPCCSTNCRFCRLKNKTGLVLCSRRLLKNEWCTCYFPYWAWLGLGRWN